MKYEIYTQETINMVQRLTLVERSRKARRERIRNFILIVIATLGIGCGLIAILNVLGNMPRGYEVVNPRYVSEEITPNESETVWIQNVSEEWLLEHGYIIVSWPDTHDTVESESNDVYWGPNPEYKNPVDTPNIDPCTWLPVNE